MSSSFLKSLSAPVSRLRSSEHLNGYYIGVTKCCGQIAAGLPNDGSLQVVDLGRFVASITAKSLDSSYIELPQLSLQFCICSAVTSTTSRT